MINTIFKWFVIACVVFVLWYFGILTVLIHLLGVVIVFVGTLITGLGNILI
jgi:hypothetical protein